MQICGFLCHLRPETAISKPVAGQLTYASWLFKLVVARIRTMTSQDPLGPGLGSLVRFSLRLSSLSVSFGSAGH